MNYWRYLFGDHFIYGLGGLSFFALVMTIIGFTIAAGIYLLKSLGLMEVAKRRNIENTWYAWIPFLDLYLLGRILGVMHSQVSFGSKTLGEMDLNFNLHFGKTDVALLIASIVYVVGNYVPYIGIYLEVFAVLVILMALYELYKIILERYALIAAVVSVLFPPVGAVLIFINRHK